MSKETSGDSAHKGSSLTPQGAEGGMRPPGEPLGGASPEDESLRASKGALGELAMPKIKKDSYSRARGGNSKILDVVCASCESEVVIYQKDGKGGLRRLYFDRTYLPDNVGDSLDKRPDKTHETLACPHCKTVIGNKTVYKPEKRDAYRLIPGTYRQEKRLVKIKPEQEEKRSHPQDSPHTTLPDES